MFATEKRVQVVARMYEIRAVLRRLDGDQYRQKLAPWMRLIAGVARERGCNELGAAIHLAKELDARNECSPAAVMRLTAAAAEILEPSEGMVQP